MQHLLTILTIYNVDVPISVYLLTKSCKNFSFENITVQNGKIAYLSIKKNIEYCFSKGLLLFSVYNSLSIKINIDGIPLYKSSNYCLWPILMIIDQCKVKTPLLIAIFAGVGKPDL